MAYSGILCYMGRLLVTAKVVPSSLILVTLMKEALGSSETSIRTRVTQRNIPEDHILYSHRQNLKSYMVLPSSIYVIVPAALRPQGQLNL
jgi:hypothetical protein